MSYTIQITEQQREILLALLVAAHPEAEAFPAGQPINEAALLRDMFHSLPHDEAEMIHVHGCTPGQAVHGFAL